MNHDYTLKWDVWNAATHNNAGDDLNFHRNIKKCSSFLLAWGNWNKIGSRNITEWVLLRVIFNLKKAQRRKQRSQFCTHTCMFTFSITNHIIINNQLKSPQNGKLSINYGFSDTDSLNAPPQLVRYPGNYILDHFNDVQTCNSSQCVIRSLKSLC